MQSTSKERILRLPVVQERTGLSRATIYNKMHAGLFPESVKLGPRSVGWPESAVNKWIADLVGKEGRSCA